MTRKPDKRKQRQAERRKAEQAAKPKHIGMIAHPDSGLSFTAALLAVALAKALPHNR